MLQRLSVRENEKPETARRRFDGQLGVRAWATPTREMADPDAVDANVPWWWSQAEVDQSTQLFMEMARARGMV
jgi:hypothetical protein